MAIYIATSARAVARLGIVLGVLGIGLAGCHRQTATVEEEESPPPASTIQDKKPELDPRLHQSFAAATRAEPPADWQPPDTTMTGKSIGKLYTQVTKLWDRIHFVSPEGKPLLYQAIVETELGPIEITLKPEVAPNHVRNFIALAEAGYYEGLVFERIVHETSEGQPDLELIEGGCPLGTGEVGFGSLGYWLKPEFNQETHVAGTVGACHEEEADTAACKFYITLSKAPYLDKNFTVFGQVTQGLDVARKIFAQPVLHDSAHGEADRPEKPVLIRKVTIHATEVESPPAN